MAEIIDEASERKKRSWEKQDQTDREDAIRALLATVKGRRFIWWLLEVGKEGIQPFTANALTTAFNCGELNVGKQILAQVIEIDPEGYLRLLKERQDERTNRDLALRNDAGDDD